MSEKCSMFLTRFPDFSGRGRSASLLDNQIILIGNNTLSGSEGSFISIQNSRDGLLAMKYTKETFPTRGSPFRHSALPSENKLHLLGGRYRSRVMLEEHAWKDIHLKWAENHDAFVPKFFSACTVQTGIDSFYIFGGAEFLDNKTTAVRNTVLHINTNSLMVKTTGTMKRPRMALGCEVLNKGLILLSGGYSDATNPLQSIEPDEIFNLTHHALSSVENSQSSTGSYLLSMADSLNRFQHSMIRMNDKVYALGGIAPNLSFAISNTSSNATTAKIKVFNEATKSWSNHEKDLKSNHTAEVVALPFPSSSLDCVPDCQCGVSSSITRIFNGTDALVSSYTFSRFYLTLFLFQINEVPWTAAILREATSAAESDCAGTLVS